MKISKSVPFVNFSVFSYDIKSCDIQVLKLLGYDLNLDVNNKSEYLIKLGNFYRDHPDIASQVKSYTKKIIKGYQNQIGNENIICTQYDGFLSTKLLKDCSQEKISIELRDILLSLIISIDRHSYIARSEKNQKILVKGVSHYYSNLDTVYKKILSLNFMNKKGIFVGLENIYNYVLKTCNDCKFYSIPIKNEKNFLLICLKDLGFTRVNKSSLQFVSTDDIDRQFYWNKYFKKFVKSIFFEFV